MIRLLEKLLKSNKAKKCKLPFMFPTSHVCAQNPILSCGNDILAFYSDCHELLKLNLQVGIVIISVSL